MFISFKDILLFMTEFSNAVFVMTDDTKHRLEVKLEEEIRTRYDYALRVGAKKILTTYDYNYLRDCILGGHISSGLISDVERYAIVTDIIAYEANLRKNPDAKFAIRTQYSYKEIQYENGEYGGYVLTYDDGHTSCGWSDLVRTLTY